MSIYVQKLVVQLRGYIFPQRCETRDWKSKLIRVRIRFVACGEGTQGGEVDVAAECALSTYNLELMCCERWKGGKSNSPLIHSGCLVQTLHRILMLEGTRGGWRRGSLAEQFKRLNILN